METIIGLIAGILTTVAFVPQVIKTWRSHSTHDISLAMFAIFTSGVFAWLLYGLMIEDLPIVVANAVTLALAGSILVMKLRNG
jgi:MtN3 and saliva related transmembrane protein